MTILGVLEVRRKLCFRAKHVVDVENTLVDLIARSEPSETNAELSHRRPDVNWCEQVMVREEEKTCFEICEAIRARIRCGSKSLPRSLEAFG